MEVSYGLGLLLYASGAVGDGSSGVPNLAANHGRKKTA
jgi:hypothetical protein